MSGPKSSRYILTPQQLRRLKEIREREQTIQQQRNQLAYLKTKLSPLKTQLQQALEKTELLLKRTSQGTEEQQQLTQALANLETAAQAADKAAQQELTKLCQAVQKISTIVEQSQTLQMHCSSPDWKITKQLTADIEHSIVQGMNLRIEEQIPKPLTPIERRRQKIKDTLQKAEQLLNLHPLSISPNISQMAENAYTSRQPTESPLYCSPIQQSLEQLRQESQEIRHRTDEITSTAFLDNYYAMTVQPFLETCEEFSQLAAQSGREYEELLARYQYDCRYLGLSEEPPVFTAAGIEQLREIVQKLEAQCAQSEAQQYIAESIDEVMRDMGYPIIGSREVTKRSGRKFRSELYHFSEGTIVNVTYSASGQISMELGGADDCGREPSDAECEQLCREMTEFCGTFSEIEIRLKEKGIILESRLSMLPPEADYAQIINVSEYQLTEPVEYFEAEEEKQEMRSIQEEQKRQHQIENQ